MLDEVLWTSRLRYSYSVLLLFIMSKRKKTLVVKSDPKQKQACRGLKAATCDKSLKWIAKNDAELSASLWLLCEPSPDLDFFPIGTLFSSVTPRRSDSIFHLTKRLLVSLLHNIHITHQS